MTLTEISDWILEQVKKLNFASAMTGNNFQHTVSNPLSFHLLYFVRTPLRESFAVINHYITYDYCCGL